MPKKSSKPSQWYTQEDAHGAASKFGQMIGEAFETAIYALIQKHLEQVYPQYYIVDPKIGKKILQLKC